MCYVLDTNVVVAGLRSPTGASVALIDQVGSFDEFRRIIECEAQSFVFEVIVHSYRWIARVLYSSEFTESFSDDAQGLITECPVPPRPQKRVRLQ